LKIYQLDETYAQSRKKLWEKAFNIALGFIVVMWLVFLLDLFLPFLDISHYGIHPRRFASITGIVSAVFLHGSISHIISNTLALLLAITALFGNYPKSATKVMVYSILFTGLLVWLFARSANHIGASGLLYCLLTYIFICGFIKKDIQSIGISLVIAFLYGSLIFGVIPDKQQHVSWESHLFGMIVGAILAWKYRQSDMPVYKTWSDEEE
jgi:membrane associated rhomboid family serine protease